MMATFRRIGPMDASINKILDFLQFSERLKRELRHSWLSDGRRESVAEHTFQMALLALLVQRYLDRPVDLLRALQLILLHDLVEAEAGDVPAWEESDRQRAKAAREQEAIGKIRDRLGGETGAEFYRLWQEFEAGESEEAKLAKALDALEVQIQHNLADLATWRPVEYGMVYTQMDRRCAHDSFLMALCEAVKRQAEEKWAEAGVRVDPRCALDSAGRDEGRQRLDSARQGERGRRSVYR